jgi:hypothetical protein
MPAAGGASGPGGEPAGRYAAQWQGYRRRRRWAVGLALGLAPVAGLWLLAAARPWLEPLAVAVGLAWLGAAAVAGWRFGRWPCPRCGRPFGMREWWYSDAVLVTRRCLHCGLAKGADPDRGPP